MGNSKPKPINDDYARTWSISSSPPFDPNTNTFQAKNKVSYTLKHQRHGVISSLLHSRSVDQQPPLRTKFFGVGGEFTCFDESNQTSQKLLFLADGIGFTPFLAMFEALTQTKQKVDIAVLFAGRGDEIDLLKHLISADIVSPMSNIPTTGSRRTVSTWASVSTFDSTGVNAPTECGSLKLYNRRMQFNVIVNVSDVTNRYVYVCGPAQLMIDAYSWLTMAGVKPSQLMKESFLF
ncbi:unnamed protein product [Rotaria socialis]|uniref:Oxidoreductase FAD/NAD(P)-binding domain-containing protein n=1 Tax=Rotaria socialis TaxID=392032 RepID=A0A818Z156_9BILA|nr:unnamed protein product [Rotaria socialis]